MSTSGWFLTGRLYSLPSINWGLSDAEKAEYRKLDSIGIQAKKDEANRSKNIRLGILVVLIIAVAVLFAVGYTVEPVVKVVGAGLVIATAIFAVVFIRKAYGVIKDLDEMFP